MTDYIVMTKIQADAVAGPSTVPGCENAELLPTLLADGERYVLSPLVKADPSHADKLDLLGSYPVQTIDASEFKLMPQPPI